MRMAAAAAPKPLSMLTVTMPGAQLASAVVSAARPPAATPYPEEELLAQQKALDFDYYWARPLVTHNLRLAA